MSDDNNTRADYRASVEAGLKRLESEKLSFLGTSNVISKFDSENLEAYAPRAEEYEDRTVTTENVPADALRAYQSPTVNDMQSVESAVMNLEAGQEYESAEGDGRDMSSIMGDIRKGSVSASSHTVVSRPNNQESAMHGALDSEFNSAVVNTIADRSATLQFASLRHTEPGVGVSNLVSPEGADEFDSSETQAVPMPHVSDQDIEEFIRTQEVGSQAARLRAMANELCDIQDDEPVYPQSRIIKPADAPLDRPEVVSSAIEKLKQQGLFNPLKAHAEVASNLQSIQGLNDFLPESEVTKCDERVLRDFEEATVPQEPDAIDGIRNVRSLVAAVNQPKPSTPEFVPVPGVDDLDLDARETMPIIMSDATLEAIEKNTKKRNLSSHEEKIDDTFLLDEQENSNPITTVLLILVIVLMLAAIGYLLYLMGIFSWIHPALDPYAEKNAPVQNEAVVEQTFADVDLEMVTNADIRASVDAVQSRIEGAMKLNAWMPFWIDEQLALQETPESQIAYIQLAREFSPDNPALLRQQLESCLNASRFDLARETWRQAPSDFRLDPQNTELHYRIFTEDPRVMAPVEILNANEEICDEIAPLGGGSTLTFKLRNKGENIAAFKPLQVRKQSNYRSEIAAWRLCEILECDFAVPRNRPIKIDHATFDKLYSRTKSSKKAVYRNEFGDLSWIKEDGVSYLYGTMKDWVPDFTRFPIELKTFWQPWLSQTKYIETLPSLESAFAPLKRNKNTQKLHTELMEQSPNLTTPQIAAQVSDVLVFDFLIGNWDRFSGVPSWWGVNCQYKDNKIVSIDNGAGFPSYSNDKVYERFMMTERYSAHFIESLRSLDKDKTLNLLFPEPSQKELGGFEQFWKQRQAVLDRVDKLSEKYGADKVLSL